MTIIIVTHNLQQAARVSDYTAFVMGEGERQESWSSWEAADEMFRDPRRSA